MHRPFPQHAASRSAPYADSATTKPRPLLLTVEQLSARNPAFTPGALRNLIFKATPRQSSRGAIAGNGLIECGAVVRLGRRVLLEERTFLAWVTRGGGR